MPYREISADDVLDLLLHEQILDLDATDSLTAETDLFAHGLDSMAMMQLLLHVEQRFQVQVPPTELTRERFTTATHLADFLSTQCRVAA